tara:strand:- start:2780 stop:3415 length:636 start_codon:yes stop_codon:yes gene_type:complete
MIDERITIQSDDEVGRLKSLYDECGPLRCVKVPPAIVDPATVEHVDIGKMVDDVHQDTDDPRSLAFIPLCEHKQTGFWCVAVFEGKTDPREGDPDANIRGSLALSVMELSPLVMFGDFRLFLAECEHDGAKVLWKNFANMPPDMADSLAEDFQTPQSFADGSLISSAASHLDVSEVASVIERLFDRYDWASVYPSQRRWSDVGVKDLDDGE